MEQIYTMSYFDNETWHQKKTLTTLFLVVVVCACKKFTIYRKRTSKQTIQINFTIFDPLSRPVTKKSKKKIVI